MSGYAKAWQQRFTLGIALALALSVVGCNSQPPASTKEQAKAKRTEKGTSPEGEPIAAPKEKAGKTNAKGVAWEFATALSEGKAKADQLTPAFRKQIAPPRTESDIALGYNPAALEEYLNKHRLTFADAFATSGSNNPSCVSLIIKESKNEALFVQMVPTTDGKSYLVGWFHRSHSPYLSNNLEKLTAESLAANCFLDTLLNEQWNLSAAWMSDRWKIDEAPPRPSDKALGYNPNFLQLKLKQLKGSFTKYQISKVEGTTVEGTLIGPETKPFTLTLVKDADTGSFTVDSLKIQ